MANIFGFTDTWNAAGTAFDCIKCTVTNTASAAGSDLLDLSITGGAQIRFIKTGVLSLSDGTNTGTITPSDTTGLAFSGSASFVGPSRGGTPDTIEGGGFTAIKLAFDQGIWGFDRNSNLHNMIRIANVPAIDGGTNDFMVLGDNTLEWVSIAAPLDMIGGHIIDVSNVGNKLGLYNTRLVQLFNSSTYNVGFATLSAVGVQTDRLTVTNVATPARVNIVNAYLKLAGGGGAGDPTSFYAIIVPTANGDYWDYAFKTYHYGIGSERTNFTLNSQSLSTTFEGNINVGGITSAFPALKRSTTELHVRLADDSADTTLQALTYKVAGTKVVGARVIDARADDVANSGDATTDGLIDALRDAMISHGLIAAA